MNLITKTLAVVAVAGVLAVGGAVTANASTASDLPAGGWVSTNTSPEYILANDGPNVAYQQGTTTFSATWNPHFGHTWQDTYLVSGYSQGQSTSQQAGPYGKYTWSLPLKATAPVRITGSMQYSVSPTFNGRPGWDIWMSQNTSDMSATALQQNPKTVEILLQPGSNSFYDTAPEGYLRLFYGVGSLANVDISWYTQKALSILGLSPKNYYWVAIDGGAEMTNGAFTVNSYSLSITTQVNRNGTIVNVPVMGASLDTLRAPQKPKAKPVIKLVADPKVSVAGHLNHAVVKQPGNDLWLLWITLGGLAVSGLVVWEIRRHKKATPEL